MCSLHKRYNRMFLTCLIGFTSSSFRTWMENGSWFRSYLCRTIEHSKSFTNFSALQYILGLFLKLQLILHFQAESLEIKRIPSIFKKVAHHRMASNYCTVFYLYQDIWFILAVLKQCCPYLFIASPCNFKCGCSGVFLAFFCCLSILWNAAAHELVPFWSFMCNSHIVYNILKIRHYGVICKVISHKYLDSSSFSMLNCLLCENSIIIICRLFAWSWRGRCIWLSFNWPVIVM